MSICLLLHCLLSDYLSVDSKSIFIRVMNGYHCLQGNRLNKPSEFTRKVVQKLVFVKESVQNQESSDFRVIYGDLVCLCVCPVCLTSNVVI